MEHLFWRPDFVNRVPDPKQSQEEGIAAAHRLCWWDL